MSLAGKTDQEKLASLSAKHYKEQATWFLNAFWNDFTSKEGENVWAWVGKHEELDPKKKEGNELDEFLGHRFLESIGTTMTVQELRNYIRSIGVEKVKYIPLCHFLLARFKADVHKLVNASQGDNQAEIEKAQALLESAQAAFNQADEKAKASSKAEAELKTALAELKAQEDAFNNKTNELKAKSESGSVVQQNKAKAELAQHLASDPLPLNRAKLNTEAATKKAEKARLAADAALEDAKNKLDQAESYLKDVQSRSGSAQGTMWWMSRELMEMKKYMPEKKGGIKKT
jgi:DNA repair exonuclease SbcCD ATPase subunit